MENQGSFKLHISDIKCDAEGCDHYESGVAVEEYENYLNKPCPKCGANLLTQEDFDAIQDLMAIEQMMKGLSEEELAVFNELGRKIIDSGEGLDFFGVDATKVKNGDIVRLKSDGTGFAGLKASIVERGDSHE